MTYYLNKYFKTFKIKGYFCTCMLFTLNLRPPPPPTLLITQILVKMSFFYYKDNKYDVSAKKKLTKTTDCGACTRMYAYCCLAAELLLLS